MTPDFYTVRELALKLRVHTNTILRYIRSGKIQGLKLCGRGYRIPASEIQRLAEFDTGEIIEKMVQKRLEEMK